MPYAQHPVLGLPSTLTQLYQGQQLHSHQDGPFEYPSTSPGYSDLATASPTTAPVSHPRNHHISLPPQKKTAKAIFRDPFVDMPSHYSIPETSIMLPPPPTNPQARRWPNPLAFTTPPRSTARHGSPDTPMSTTSSQMSPMDTRPRRVVELPATPITLRMAVNEASSVVPRGEQRQEGHHIQQRKKMQNSRQGQQRQQRQHQQQPHQRHHQPPQQAPRQAPGPAKQAAMRLQQQQEAYMRQHYPNGRPFPNGQQGLPPGAHAPQLQQQQQYRQGPQQPLFIELQRPTHVPNALGIYPPATSSYPTNPQVQGGINRVDIQPGAAAPPLQPAQGQIQGNPSQYQPRQGQRASEYPAEQPRRPGYRASQKQQQQQQHGQLPRGQYPLPHAPRPQFRPQAHYGQHRQQSPYPHQQQYQQQQQQQYQQQCQQHHHQQPQLYRTKNPTLQQYQHQQPQYPHPQPQQPQPHYSHPWQRQGPPHPHSLTSLAALLSGSFTTHAVQHAYRLSGGKTLPGGIRKLSTSSKKSRGGRGGRDKHSNYISAEFSQDQTSLLWRREREAQAAKAVAAKGANAATDAAVWVEAVGWVPGSGSGGGTAGIGVGDDEDGGEGGEDNGLYLKDVGYWIGESERRKESWTGGGGHVAEQIEGGEDMDKLERWDGGDGSWPYVDRTATGVADTAVNGVGWEVLQPEAVVVEGGDGVGDVVDVGEHDGPVEGWQDLVNWVECGGEIAPSAVADANAVAAEAGEGTEAVKAVEDATVVDETREDGEPVLFIEEPRVVEDAVAVEDTGCGGDSITCRSKGC